MPSLHVELYGCSMNRGEAELLINSLLMRGHDLEKDPENADLNIIFTCTVIERTEKNMIRAIRSLPTSVPLLVAGCMASAQPNLIKAIRPDAVLLPPDHYSTFIDVVEDLTSAPRQPRRPVRHGSVLVLPIASGCLGDCTYCITKIARPVLRSRTIDEMMRTVREANGAVEIRLSAQDTAAYGRDIGTGLPELIKAITSADGDFMIRVGMMNPDTAKTILPDLLEVFEHEKVFKFLHIPVQSGSDRILASMGRNYTVFEFRQIIEDFRKRFPDISISTDIIVGYPGEREEDFRASLSLVKDLKPNIVNVTRFSPRPGTPAFSAMPLPGWLVKRRSREVSALRKTVSLSINRSYIGEVTDVLITERGKKGTVMARLHNYIPVVLTSEMPPGKRVRVRIVDCTDAYLIGIPSD